MSLLRPQPKEKKPNLFQRAVGGLSKFGSQIIAGPKERVQAVAKSIKTRSLTPLKESFNKQNKQIAEQFNSKSPAGLINIVASFNTFGENVTKGGPRTGEVLTHEVAPEIAPKKPSLLRDVQKQVEPALNIIKHEGAAGEELAGKITTAADVGEVQAGKRIAALQAAPKLNRTEAFNLKDVLEGTAEPVNSNVAKAATVIKKQLDSIVQEAQQADVLVKRKVTLQPGADTTGLTNLQREALAAGKEVKATIKTPFQGLPDYFPHIIPNTEALSKGAIRTDVVENLVRTGTSKTLTEAEKFVDAYRNFIDTGQRQDSLLKYMTETGQAKNEADALANLQQFRNRTIKRQGSLEYSRQIDLPFYDPNPNRVIPQYLVSTSKRLAEIKQFGQNQEVVNKLINDVRKAGGNADQVRKVVDRILGIVNSTSPAKRLSSFLRTLQGFKLGLASIPNATQGVLNSLLKGDLQALGAGLKGLLTKEGRLFGLESGATLESTLNEITNETGALKTFLKATGFSATEKANRIIAANAGKYFGERMFTKALKGNTRAIEALKELGVSIEGKTALTGDDILMMAKKFSDITQFRSRPQDLPFFASTDAGKIFFQFKNFIYGQTRLLYNTTLKEFRAGNFGRGTRNVLILATLFPLTGEAIADIRSYITGKKRTPTGFGRWLDDIAQTGAMGAVWDSIQAAKFQKGLEYLVGPTLADAGELLNAFGASNKVTAVGRFIAKKLPIIGSRVSSSLFPTKTATKKRVPSKLRR